MRRADRLFRLVEILRSKRPATGDRRPATGDRRPATGDRRPATGDRQAGQLGVSLRTLYRDIADLGRSGVPIEGEAGVG